MQKFVKKLVVVEAVEYNGVNKEETAKTALQDASMWGVAALTHQITFDTFEN